VDNNYTTGRNLTPEDRKTFLAGQNKFRPEILEIWGLKPIQTK
jgi:hypothetical protein